MDGMTREQINSLCDDLKAAMLNWRGESGWEQINKLCDLALQSLSLESVRSEALKLLDEYFAAYPFGRLGDAYRALQSPARVAEGVEPKETVSDNELSLTELIATLDRRQYSRARKVTLNGDEYHQLRNAALSPAAETQGTWQERCSALYQVVGCMASIFGVFETSDDVSDALDVAAGRGNVEKLLPWPKVDLRTLVKAEEKDVHSIKLRK